MKGGEVGMIIFELTMPQCGSWNGKWWWTACVSVTRLTAGEARKLERKSDGFCGYDWMIKSICNKGFIEPD